MSNTVSSIRPSMLQAVGNTPLVQLTKLPAPQSANILVKKVPTVLQGSELPGILAGVLMV